MSTEAQRGVGRQNNDFASPRVTSRPSGQNSIPSTSAQLSFVNNFRREILFVVTGAVEHGPAPRFSKKCPHQRRILLLPSRPNNPVNASFLHRQFPLPTRHPKPRLLSLSQTREDLPQSTSRAQYSLSSTPIPCLRRKFGVITQQSTNSLSPTIRSRTTPSYIRTSAPVAMSNNGLCGPSDPTKRLGAHLQRDTQVQQDRVVNGGPSLVQVRLFRATISSRPF